MKAGEVRGGDLRRDKVRCVVRRRLEKLVKANFWGVLLTQQTPR